MKHILKISFLLSLLIISGCNKTVCVKDIVEQKWLFPMNSHAWFVGYFYIGSDDENHYFIGKWKYQIDDKICINKKLLDIPSEYPLGTKEQMITMFKGDENDKPLFTFDNRTYYVFK